VDFLKDFLHHHASSAASQIPPSRWMLGLKPVPEFIDPRFRGNKSNAMSDALLG